MKILLIASTESIFVKELKSELSQKDYDVFVLDLSTLKIYENYDLINNTYADRLSRYKNIPKLGTFFKFRLIAKVIEENHFDVINIHQSDWKYLLISNSLSRHNVILTFYGSDFYRTSNRIKNIQRALYKKVQKLIFTNPATKNHFIDYYQEFEEKCHVCRFGLKTLDFIDKNRTQDIKALKKSLGYSLEKYIVTCGHNSTKAQQHDKIIENLIQLPQEVKNNTQFIFPLTYGEAENKQRVKQLLLQTDLDYLVLEEYLYEDRNAAIKLASNVMINILQTDSFSGSMQEFLYAGNTIITGSWLPYNLFDSKGVCYEKIDAPEQLKDRLVEVLTNFDSYRPNNQTNREIVYSLSGWINTIDCWTKLYLDQK